MQGRLRGGAGPAALLHRQLRGPRRAAAEPRPRHGHGSQQEAPEVFPVRVPRVPGHGRRQVSLPRHRGHRGGRQRPRAAVPRPRRLRARGSRGGAAAAAVRGRAGAAGQDRVRGLVVRARAGRRGGMGALHLPPAAAQHQDAGQKIISTESFFLTHIMLLPSNDEQRTKNKVINQNNSVSFYFPSYQY